MKNNPRRSLMLMILLAITFYLAMQNLGTVAAALMWILGVVTPVITGLCIAFILNIPMSFLEGTVLRGKKRLVVKFRRPLSMLLSYAMGLGLIVLVVWVVLPQISAMVNLLIAGLPDYAQKLSDWLSGLLAQMRLPEARLTALRETLDSVGDELLELLKRSSTLLAGNALSFTASVLGGVVDVVIALVISVNVLAKKEAIARLCARMLRAYLPVRTGARLFRISRLSYRAFGGFLRGQFTESLILGALCFVGMTILGFPNAAVISVLIGGTAIVPVIGPWVGGALATLLMLVMAPDRALWFLLFVLVLSQVEDNLIYPRVVGNSMGLPGLLVLTAVVVGVNVYGIMGLLLSVPLTSVLYTLLREGIDRRLKRRRARPQERVESETP